MAPEHYDSWCRSWFAECERLSKRIMVFPSHQHLPMWYKIRRPSANVCWYKPGNPSGGGVFQFCEWEPVLLWGKGMGGSDVFREPINRQPDTGCHPCPKPLHLMKQILARARPCTVLDPFAGSGSTLLAARALEMHATGIELEERYCEIIVKRLAQGVLDFSAEVPLTHLNGRLEGGL